MKMKMRDFYVLFLRKAHNTEHPSRGCPHMVLIFTAQSTEAMRKKCLAQGNNILLPGFEPSTSVTKTDILANRPICSKKEMFLLRKLCQFDYYHYCSESDG